MPGQAVLPAAAAASKAAQSQVSTLHPAKFTDHHLKVLAAGFAARSVARGQNIVPALRPPGRIPSCLFLEPGKPAFGFF